MLALDLLYSPGQPSDVPIAQTPVVTAARMDRSPSTESVLPHSSSNTEFAALLSEPLTVTLQTIESDVAAPCEAKPAPNTCVDNYPVDTCDTKSPLRLSSPMELTVTVDDSSSITITNSAAKSTIVKSPVVSSAKRHVCENSMSAHSDCTFSSPQLKLTTTFPLVNSEATHTSSSKTVPTEVSVTLFSPEHIIANSGTSVTTPQMNIYRVDPSVLDPLSDQKLTDDTTYDRHSPGCDTSGEAQSEASPTARDAHAGKAHWSAVAQLSLIAEEGDISATQETSPMDEQSNCRIDASAPLGSSKFMFISPPWSQGSKQTTHISASIAAVSSNSSVDSIHPCRFLISPAMNSLEYSGISSLSSHWSASRSSGQ